MSMSVVRRFVVLGLVLGLALALPGAAAAVITKGSCQATGTATSSGTVDLTTATEWHMKSTDVAGGNGTAAAKQTSAEVAAYGLGIGLPIASGSGDGDTAGSVSGVQVSTYAILGARFTVAGSSVGEDGGCAGHVTIILDDVNPLLTVFGGGGALLAVIGLVGLVWAARSPSSCASQILAALFGLLGGGGLGLALEQFGILDPTVPIGLGLAIILAIIGFLIAGRLSKAAAEA
jgi:hypothetical protein